MEMPIKTPGGIQDPKAGGTPGATSPSGTQPGAQGNQPGTDSKVPIQALHEEREKRQALQAETQSLKEQIAEMQATMNVSPNPTGVNAGGQVYNNTAPAPNPQMKKLEELWETDPRRAMQTELMMGLQWYDSVNVSLDEQEEAVEKKHNDFSTYRREIRKYVRTLPAADRAKRGVVELAYFIVRGQNSESVWDKRQADLLEKIKRGESVQGFTGIGTTSPNIQPKPTKLTSEQAKVAEAMGMSADDYLKNIKV